MRFSLVIPVYNVEPWLRECLDSMLSQTCDDWEAVCVDDGSTDGCPAILREYADKDSRIRILTQPNGGLSAARNTGLAAAQGEYILFLDSDDWLEPNALRILADHIGGEDLLCFNGQYTDTVDHLVPEQHITGWDYYCRYALQHREFPFVCVVLRCYRRQFLVDNGLRFREGLLHEDNEFTPRVCLAAQSVTVIPDLLYRYRRREGSIMTTRSFRSRHDMLLIANELTAIFIERDDLDRSVVYRALTHHYQAAFAGATRQETNQLRALVDWHLYRAVSRTRPRHRLNYLLLRHLPALFTATCRN